MRISRTIGRGAVIATAAIGLLLPNTTPAQADQAGAGVATFNVCGGTHCVVGTLETTIYPTGLGTDVVEFTCKIVASGAAVSTTVSACSVGGVNALAVPLSAPGPAVATTGAGLFAAGSTVTACVGGSAVWAEAVLGPISKSGSGCGRAITLSIG